MNAPLKPGINYIAISTPFYCINEYGELLLHKRSKQCRDEHGTWDTGAGQLEFGENPESGVLREVEEEYGVQGKILEQLKPISVIRKNTDKITHWLAIPFVIQVEKDKVKINEPKKIDELRWCTLDTLPKPLHSAFNTYIVQTDRINSLKKFMMKKR